MSNSGISFVSWGGKTPKMGVNRLRREVQFLLSTFDIAALRWLTLCLWSHPTWFEGNTLLFALTCHQSCDQKPRCMDASRYPAQAPGSSNSPNTSYHVLAPRTVPGGWGDPFTKLTPKWCGLKGALRMEEQLASHNTCELLSSTGRCNLFLKLWKNCNLKSFLTYTYLQIFNL